jgi:hypothetical protein
LMIFWSRRVCVEDTGCIIVKYRGIFADCRRYYRFFDWLFRKECMLHARSWYFSIRVGLREIKGV